MCWAPNPFLQLCSLFKEKTQSRGCKAGGKCWVTCQSLQEEGRGVTVGGEGTMYIGGSRVLICPNRGLDCTFRCSLEQSQYVSCTPAVVALWGAATLIPLQGAITPLLPSPVAEDGPVTLLTCNNKLPALPPCEISCLSQQVGGTAHFPPHPPAPGWM